MIDSSGSILMTSTLHRMRRAREEQSRAWNPGIPRFPQVLTIYPTVLIYLSVDSWPAKNQNPPILSGTMPEQYQNDEIRDLKCATSPSSYLENVLNCWFLDGGGFYLFP
jgi:hypothetical protein